VLCGAFNDCVLVCVIKDGVDGGGAGVNYAVTKTNLEKC